MKILKHEHKFTYIKQYERTICLKCGYIPELDKKNIKKPAKQPKETIDYCLRDYKNHHSWQSIGVITRANGQIAQVLKCSQCQKCYLKNLEEITRVFK